MTCHRMTHHVVEKPWGRNDVPARYGATPGQRIGEVWFTAPDDMPQPLLVKYLFTSERLSIQVHPNDRQAQARGLAGGKSECWHVLETEGDARLGIGLMHEIGTDALRAHRAGRCRRPPPHGGRAAHKVRRGSPTGRRPDAVRAVGHSRRAGR